MTTKLSAAIAAFILVVAPPLSAKTIFFGPTPYLSAADSPFDLSGLGSTFWLEDFEDGELNTPGVSALELEFYPGAIRQPSIITDSVDGDDGDIDGFGMNGRSLQSYHSLCSSTQCRSSIVFYFDPVLLGGYPTQVGFVFTDGAGPFTRYSFGVQHPDGSESGPGAFPWDVESYEQGSTVGDRFVGVSTSRGIVSLYIGAAPLTEFEIDHLQYGRVVPEPGTFGTLAVGLAVVCVAPQAFCCRLVASALH